MLINIICTQLQTHYKILKIIEIKSVLIEKSFYDFSGLPGNAVPTTAFFGKEGKLTDKAQD